MTAAAVIYQFPESSLLDRLPCSGDLRKRNQQIVPREQAFDLRIPLQFPRCMLPTDLAGTGKLGEPVEMVRSPCAVR
jgi:hypothetical protein